MIRESLFSPIKGDSAKGCACDNNLAVTYSLSLENMDSTICTNCTLPMAPLPVNGILTLLATTLAFKTHHGTSFTHRSLQRRRPWGSTTMLAAKVTPAMVKELREATGVGMMDCKKALMETDGDKASASELLRKKGHMKAEKKASRTTAEGRIVVARSDVKAVMVEINCETDFVTMDELFLNFTKVVSENALRFDGNDVSSLGGTKINGETVEEVRQGLVARLGENIQIRRLVSRGKPGRTVGSYVHRNRIGALVELVGGSEQLASDIAMHVAAMDPPFAIAEEVPPDVIEKERQVLTVQAMSSGKPQEIVEKMVEGRIRKLLGEICLVSQTYVQDSDKTVADLLKESDANIIGFSRFAVGEGIDKIDDDFAAEVRGKPEEEN